MVCRVDSEHAPPASEDHTGLAADCNTEGHEGSRGGHRHRRAGRLPPEEGSRLKRAGARAPPSWLGCA